MDLGEILQTVLGATVGGLITLVGIWWTLRHQNRQHVEAMKSQTAEHREVIQLEIDQVSEERKRDRVTQLRSAAAEVDSNLWALDSYLSDDKPDLKLGIPTLRVERTLDALPLVLSGSVVKPMISASIKYALLVEQWNQTARLLESSAFAGGSHASAGRDHLTSALRTSTVKRSQGGMGLGEQIQELSSDVAGALTGALTGALPDGEAPLLSFDPPV